MNKIFATLILSVGLTPAWAEWVLRAGSENSDLYINYSSIVTSADLTRGWILFDKRRDASGSEGSSIVLLKQVNCKNGQMRDLQETTYLGQMGNGTALNTYTTPSEWSYPIPNTLNERVFTTLCNIK